MTINALIIPGYTDGAAWTPGDTNHAAAMALPGQLASLGANWAVLQYSYFTANWSSTNVSSRSVTDAGIAAMVAACRAAGLKVMLKPHLAMTDGGTQDLFIPGSQQSRQVGVGNTAPANGTYSAGKNTVSSTWLALTSANTGDRIVTPTAGHTNEIPNSNYANSYGLGAAPAYTTITFVDATHATMSANATASSSTANFYILHDANAATCMSNWTTAVMHDLSLAAVDGINLSTEHDWWTRYYPAAWATLNTAVKAAYPGIKTLVQSGNGLTVHTDIPFANQMDYIGISCYPSVGSSGGGDSQASVNAKWSTALAPMAGYSSAWGVPYLLGETGARSIVGAGYNPSNYSGGTAQNPDTDQSKFCTGWLTSTVGQSWYGGGCWWTGMAPTTPFSGPWTGTETTSYEPKTLTQAAMRAGFAPLARFFNIGGTRYRSA